MSESLPLLSLVLFEAPPGTPIRFSAEAIQRMTLQRTRELTALIPDLNNMPQCVMEASYEIDKGAIRMWISLVWQPQLQLEFVKFRGKGDFIANALEKERARILNKLDEAREKIRSLAAAINTSSLGEMGHNFGPRQLLRLMKRYSGQTINFDSYVGDIFLEFPELRKVFGCQETIKISGFVNCVAVSGFKLTGITIPAGSGQGYGKPVKRSSKWVRFSNTSDALNIGMSVLAKAHSRQRVEVEVSEVRNSITEDVAWYELRGLGFKA